MAYHNTTDLDKIYRWMTQYSTTIIPPVALNLLRRYSPMIEIGAGNGYLLYLLRQLKLDVIGFNPIQVEKTWTSVKIGGPNFVKYYPHYNLLLNWPINDREMAYHAIKNYYESGKGTHLILVGEYRREIKIRDNKKNQKTIQVYTMATNKFYQYLERNYKLVLNKTLPNWVMTESQLRIYEVMR